MGQGPWGDPATEGLLALAVQLIAAGDPRGVPLVRLTLIPECGREFAETVATALGAGAPPSTFAFLPQPAATVDATAAGAADTEVPAAPVHRPDFQSAAPLPASGYASVAQVAAHFGVSVKAVYRWMGSGRIQAQRRPGGSYRIPVAQFRSQRGGE